VLVEYARNVLGLGDADHAETSPEAETPVVSALACSLVGQTHPVSILPDTRAAELYGTKRSDESFYCSYGLNPGYREQLESSGLRVSGIDDEGDVRIAELVDHPFYLGTLFIPQSGPRRGAPHPVLQGFAVAAGA
jgi:CTP synthase (UTP-ammonia lyase)